MNISNSNPLERAALQWWRSHRPCAFSELEHMKNPTINLATDTDKRLARVVARTLMSRGSGNLQAPSIEVRKSIDKVLGKKRS
jgi:hypothetical protein